MNGQLVSLVGKEERRVDIDWLRIALFMLLILFHVGMFYVPWQWHVKSTHAPVEALSIPMRLMSPWRIPALFVISGVALRFALDKAENHYSFFKHRFARLGLPILFGMAVVCAPQAYLELKQNNVGTGNWFEFYLGYLSPPWVSPDNWTVITPTWNHLWYVVYVLLLSSLMIAISALLNGNLQIWLDKTLDRLGNWPMLLFLILISGSLLSFAVLHESAGAVQMVWGDWFRLVDSLWLMFFGFAIAKHSVTWSILLQGKWLLLTLAAATGVVLTLINLEWFWVGSDYDKHYYSVRIVFSWAVILTLLGFVQSIGRGSDNIRRYLSDAVFPYYVLHQTIIIVLGVWLDEFRLWLLAESVLLIIFTAVFTAMLYHFVIRKLGKAAVLFGGRSV